MGDYIRKVRLARNLPQADVANIIGVTTHCITNWGLNRFPPWIKYYPTIIRFLGFDPTLNTGENSLANQVMNYRKKHGFSRKRLAKLWGMYEKTIGRVEDRERVFDKIIEKIITKLKDVTTIKP